MSFTESVVESAVLSWLETSSWQGAYGPEIALGIPAVPLSDYGVIAQTREISSDHAGYAVAVRNNHANEVSLPELGTAGGGI